MPFASETDRLTLQLSARDDRLEIRAAGRGEARAETSLPPARLVETLAKYPAGDFPEAALAPLGAALGKSLLVGDVGKLAADLLADARAAEQPLHVELRFDPQEVALARFPWELIRDEQGRFLLRDGLIDLTRYISYPQPPAGFDVRLRDLPLLRVIAQPASLPGLSFGDLGLPRVELLPHASFDSLSRKLLVDGLPLWGVQFDGHGALLLQCRRCDALSLPAARFCRTCGGGLADARRVGGLAFERAGQVEWVAADDFGSVLYNARVRLAMLLACESARIGDSLVWSGLAPNLVLAGIPAVVGMQYPVFDDYANLFARTFYAALLRDGDVVAALRTARRIDPREAWYSPVLYLRQQKRSADSPMLPAIHERSVDTAVPAAARAGTSFLVRCWIRRPETRPLDEGRLRAELDVPAHIPVQTGASAAAVTFNPVAGRALRRGEVEVRLGGLNCEVARPSIMLFVDEHLDAPPAIFVVRATEPGRATLIFEVCQDGGQIASVVHHLDVHAGDAAQAASVTSHSRTLPVERGLPQPPAPQPTPLQPPAPSPALPVPSPTLPAPQPTLPAPSLAPRPTWSTTRPLPPPPAAPAPSAPWSSPLVAPAGWAFAGGLKAGGLVAPVPAALDLLLGFCAGLLVGWGLRRAEPNLRAPHLLAIATGWAIGWAAFPFLAGGLSADGAATTIGRIGAGIISGVLGGTITALAIAFARPSIDTRRMAAIAAGWVVAFAAAALLNPVLAAVLPGVLAGAIFWGLIALAGVALTLRQLERM